MNDDQYKAGNGYASNNQNAQMVEPYQVGSAAAAESINAGIAAARNKSGGK